MVWRDGTRALVLEPFDLLTRLVAAVPAALVVPPPFCAPRATFPTSIAFGSGSERGGKTIFPFRRSKSSDDNDQLGPPPRSALQTRLSGAHPLMDHPSGEHWTFALARHPKRARVDAGHSPGWIRQKNFRSFSSHPLLAPHCAVTLLQ